MRQHLDNLTRGNQASQTSEVLETSEVAIQDTLIAVRLVYSSSL
jgi:hypothetical protein